MSGDDGDDSSSSASSPLPSSLQQNLLRAKELIDTAVLSTRGDDKDSGECAEVYKKTALRVLPLLPPNSYLERNLGVTLAWSTFADSEEVVTEFQWNFNCVLECLETRRCCKRTSSIPDDKK